MRNDYTLRFESELYQIERQAITTGLRGANVRVEKRLDGTLAVRYGEKYLPVKLCVPAEKKASEPPPVKPPDKRSRQPQRGSDWNRNFDLKKGPKIWQAAQGSGRRTSEDAGRQPHITAIQQEVARRQSSPITGKLSARPAGKPGDFLIANGEFATIPSSPLASRSYKNTEAPQYAFFKAWRNLSGPMGLQNQTKPWDGIRPPPAGRPRTQVKERAGRIALLLIVRR